MEFHVLGPLEVLDDGRPVAVTAPRQRALLAVLLVHANEVVSTDRLLDLVWGEDQPDVSALRYQVSKLRESLSDDAIATQSPGYVIPAEHEQLDALQFEKLLADARSVLAADAGRGVELLDQALALWRGDPYADFTYEEFAASEIRRLAELRLEAIEARFDALLAQGRDQELVGDLQALVEEHPRREGLTASLMLALYRSGRQADALAAFQKLRTELGEELGIEPSQELVDLEGRMLLQDDSLAVEAAPPAADYLRGYILRGRIGEGAHGVVWRAAQPGVGREVAIKAIHPDIANRPGFVRRFEMEAQLVASLEHPHIVSLFDFWRDPEGAYLVMPHLRGGNVAGLMRQGPLSTEAALELVDAVGSALSYAHRRGVVHRDVTPQNVLLDDEGHPYLADFGVAALIGETAGPSSSSPAYLAPEQHAGRGAVPESDVYSLGMLAYSVLTGAKPDVGRSVAPPSQLNPDIPVAVDEVIARATAPDIAERFLDPVHFVAALADCLNGGGRSTPTFIEETRNPYKGLRAFAESDAPDFFGRDVVVGELVDAIARHRLVAVVGPSGCGKSSLVRAGLLADLRGGVLPGSERWLITDMYPGSRPLRELAEALRRVAVEWPPDLQEQLLLTDPGSMLDRLLPRDAELLVVVDQFEELFTQTVDEEQRSQFLEVLHRLATDPRARCRVLVTLRADFFDRPLEYAGFGDLLRKGVVSVTVPSVESLEQIVVGPAEAVGLTVEPGLERTITRDVADQPGGLPLLEYALTELFHERAGSELTAAGHHKTGGVLGALSSRAEELFTAYDETGRAAAEQVFLRLVTVEEGADDTRRRISLTELYHLGVDPDALQHVLDDYGSHRLLTFDRDPETREPTVEVAHEALLARWERLRSWIDERRDDLVLHRRLGAAVNEWGESSEDPTYLLKAGRLEHYEHFAASTDIALTAREWGYLEASREAEDAAKARQRRRRLGVLTTIGAVAVIAVVLAVLASLAQRDAEDARADALESEQVAIDQRDRADAAADDAQTQRALAEENALKAEANAIEAETNAALARVQELVAEARLATASDSELAILLALEAVSHDGGDGPLKEAVEALHEAVTSSRVRLTVPGTLRAGVSGSGELIATRSPGEPVKVIRVADGATLLELPLAGDPEIGELGELSMALSRDGSVLVTGRSDGTVAVWDVATGDEVLTTNDVQRIWLDGTDSTFALAYGESTTGPLDFDASPQAIEAALEQIVEIDDVVVVGGGTFEDPWVVTFNGTSSQFIRRLEAVVPGMAVVEPFEDFVELRIDAASGSYVLSVDGAGSEPLDVAATAEEVEINLEMLPGMPDVFVFGEGGFFGVVPANDGDAMPEIAVASIDLVARASATGRGHDHPDDDGWVFDGVHSLEISPDGTVLASRGWDGTIRLWDSSSWQQLAALDAPLGPADLRGLAFSPDGTMLAATDGGDFTWVWEVETGTLQHTLEVPGGAIDVAFQSDGEAVYIARVVFGDVAGGGLGIWDLESGEEQIVSGAWSLSTSVSVNPDGNRVAVGDDGGNVELFAVTDYGLEPLYEMRLHDTRIWDLVFASDADLLVSVAGATAVVTDVGASGSSEWMTMSGSAWGLPSVAYSPDGTMLARAPVQGNIVVVDAMTGDELLTLPANVESVSELDFSPDGRRLAAAVTESGAFVQVWDIATRSLLAQPVADEQFLSLPWHDCPSVDFSPDGRYLAATIPHTQTTQAAVRMWDAATFEQVLALDIPEGSDDNYEELAFTPDSRQLAVRGTFDGVDTVQFYDLDGTLDRTCCEHFWWWWSAPIEFSADGTRMVTGGMDPVTEEGTVNVWEVATGDLLATLEGHPAFVLDAVFSPDGTMIASGSGPDVRVWDGVTYEEMATLDAGEGSHLQGGFQPQRVTVGIDLGYVRSHPSLGSGSRRPHPDRARPPHPHLHRC